ARPEGRTIAAYIGNGTGRTNRSVHLEGCLISGPERPAGAGERRRGRSLAGNRILVGHGSIAHRVPQVIHLGEAVPLRPLGLAGFGALGVEPGSEPRGRLDRSPLGLCNHSEEILAPYQLHEPRNLLEAL